MAETIATPENLQQFASELGQTLAEELGGTTPAGSSDYVRIDSYISKNAHEVDGVPHLYIAVNSNVSIAGCALRYCRKGRVICRRSESSPYHDNNSIKAHTNGWHQVWQLPLHSVRTPLFTPVLVSEAPAFTIGDISYYEVTVDNYTTFFDFVTSGMSTGYQAKVDGDLEDVELTSILAKAGGICLMRNGVQISNFASVRVYKYEGGYSIGK